MTVVRRGSPVKIGAQLRAVRIGRGMTIEEVARGAGLTKGFVSRMERDEVSASVASLVALCEVLGIPVGQLLDAPDTTIVRANEGKPINFGGRGACEAVVTPRGERRLQVIRSVIEPGGEGGKRLYALDTDVEFVFVLRGSLDVIMVDQIVTLGTGDAFTFPGRKPHSWRNASASELVEVLWVLAPAT